jgi:hypothetical protein
VRIRTVAKTRAQLDALALPSNARQPEALPWILYHQKTYTSGTTTKLTFFDAVESDDTLGNMETQGSLPDPQYFEIHYIGADFLLDATTAAGGEVGAIDDVAKLLFTGRGTWTLSIAKKAYGPFPLSFLHASGGPTGFGWGTFTAEESIQYANNGIFDGGWCVGGALIIPPKVGFSFEVRWSAAQTLNAGNTGVRAWMAGVLHRQVR